jgi:TonB-linked SusC/RagA family outer membrane protein
MWKTRLLAAVALAVPMAGVAHAQQPPPAPAPAAQQPPAAPTPPPAPPPAPTRVVTGLVEDGGTHAPLAGATVKVNGTATEVTTDDQGFFVLTNLPAGELTLQVVAPGHDPAAVTMPFERGSVRVELAVTGAAPAAPAGPAAAGTRKITGVVTEKKTGVPIIAAMVQVKGTTTAVFTEDNGSFSIDAPVGPVVLEVTEGEHETLTINVKPDEAAVTVVMAEEAAEVIEITQRAPRITRQNKASSASVVQGDDLSRVSAGTVDDALQGKVAGANIQANSGAPGGGVQVRMRGVSTINGQSSPLYVVDGVVMSNIAIASGISAVTGSTAGSNASSTQDNQVNRIADIDPNDIQSVEILKGASAAALYGSKAANGVVIITTKRGRGKTFHASVTQRFGFATLANKLGSREYKSREEVLAAFPSNPEFADLYTGKTYDHEAELTDVRLGSETVANVSGGGDAGSFIGSLLVKDEPGVIIGTGYDKQSFRLGFNRDFGNRFKLQLSSNLVHSTSARGMTNNDNNNVSHYIVFAETPNFFNFGRNPDGTYPKNPFIGSGTNPLQTVALMQDREEVYRFIGSAAGSLRLVTNENVDSSLVGNLGIDRFQQHNTLIFPPELFFEPADGLLGTALSTEGDNLNVNAGLTGNFTFTPDTKVFKSSSTLGLTYETRDLNTVYVTSKNLTAGQTNLDSGSNIDVNQIRQKVNDRGAFFQEEVLLLNESLSLLGAVLAEQSSVNGDPKKLYFYPKASAAYKIPGMAPRFDLLQVRAAYGETGNQPLYGQKFTPLTATGTIEGHPGINNGGVAGDPNIKPERQREFEGGVDAVTWDSRLVVELTGYQRTISDLLLSRAVAPSTGFTTQFFNGGELRNRGVELTVQVEPVKTHDFDWLSRIVFTLNRSKITDLPVPSFLTGGFGTGLGAFRIEEGASATQIVGNQGVDATGTPIVKKLGDTEPTFRMSFVNNLTFGDFALTSLIDWQQGSDVINLTRFLYDAFGNAPDFEASQARLEKQKTDASVYIEDATFVKLREVSISYTLPKSLLAQLGPLSNGVVSLSGRNLLTLTNYSGLDPEVSNFGNQPIARNIDVAPYPPSRSFWLSLTAQF